MNVLYIAKYIVGDSFHVFRYANICLLDYISHEECCFNYIWLTLCFTKKNNTIQQLMDADKNNDIARSHVKVFNVLLVEFMDLHVAVHYMVPA
jgi:hypothetical protein